MAAGLVSRVMRAPGRLLANPTTSFATTAYPYGAVELGKTNGVILQSFGTPFRIECEGLGEATDILEANKQYVFSCFLRGFDDNAVEQILAQGFSAGATTQHAVFGEPGNVPGSSSIGRAVIIAYIPDDPVNVDGVLVYRGIPDWTDGAELAFQRGSELGIPIAIDCLRDANGNMLKIGRIADLALT